MNNLVIFCVIGLICVFDNRVTVDNALKFAKDFVECFAKTSKQKQLLLKLSQGSNEALICREILNKPDVAKEFHDKNQGLSVMRDKLFAAFNTALKPESQLKIGDIIWSLIYKLYNYNNNLLILFVCYNTIVILISGLQSLHLC